MLDVHLEMILGFRGLIDMKDITHCSQHVTRQKDDARYQSVNLQYKSLDLSPP